MKNAALHENIGIASVEDKIDNFIANDERLSELIEYKSVEDFPSLQLSDFSDFTAGVKDGSIELYTAPVLTYKLGIIEIFGTPQEVSVIKIMNKIPVLFIISYVVMAVVLGNYWLLFGIFLSPVAAFSSSRSPFAKLLNIANLVFLIFLLIKGSHLISAIPIGLIILNIHYIGFKKVYRQVLTDRAQQSEKAFLVLMAFGMINVFRKSAGVRLERLQLI